MSASAGEWLRIHAFVPESYANGPGRRAVVWVQGCSLGCPGCFNPATHSLTYGRVVLVDELFSDIAALTERVEGLTLSGGEPLQQRRGVLALLRRIRCETSLSVVVLTGYSWEEFLSFPESDELSKLVDVVIAGRYESSRNLASSLRGSANKTVHRITNRYQSSDLQDGPAAEVIISETGDLISTGIKPVLFKIV